MQGARQESGLQFAALICRYPMYHERCILLYGAVNRSNVLRGLRRGAALRDAATRAIVVNSQEGQAQRVQCGQSARGDVGMNVVNAMERERQDLRGAGTARWDRCRAVCLGTYGGTNEWVWFAG